MTGVIKVLVVDDSAFMRKVICDILEGSCEIRVIGTARNGVEALDKVKSLNPDVMTLDIEMPVMDGLACMKELSKISRIPVIVVSSLTQKSAKSTIEALEYGAVDFITKPSNLFEMAGKIKAQELIDKVKMTKNITIHNKQIEFDMQKLQKSGIVKSNNIKKIVAIGTSTGGPKSLQEVIPKIAGNIPAAFLVVQHMPPGFTKSLAERLNSMSELTVKEAEDGEIIRAGYVYIAPGDFHMLVNNIDNQLRIKLSSIPPVGGHRPSVDVMMNSLSDTNIENIIAVIMTGMGNDGSEGITNIKRYNNGFVIAQDEKTSVVYGMPKAAVKTGVVDFVVPLHEIASQIMKIVGVS